MKLNNKEEVEKAVKSNTGKLVLLVLEEDEPSSKQLMEVSLNLSKDFSEIVFKCVNSDLVGDLYTLKCLPTVLFFENSSLLNSLEGCSTSVLVSFVRGWAANSNESTVDKIERLLREHPVLLFMKGDKAEPFCRFSRAVVNMLNSSGVKFEGYNIFDDPKLREELKAYSNWPTYPQLYVNGNLIGGHDIIKELYETNSLRKEIPAEYLT
ncbi:glutaredoxin-related protein, putative [Theileria annulata]|uniref:Glutaredoxin-related protein, putative n=1 Tax=Theileria annulata TaxID=5874 RepID=Q4UDP5_THEAN|nr:glutaredoxin-related protein, putative [Theileria annulata]CAI74794.1 glutaredoxin-related protein, putative [Theileria annulata]|eukprot:XP_952526.1 glutaredoxin-related protein, putative [Theileria annulata]